MRVGRLKSFVYTEAWTGQVEHKVNPSFVCALVEEETARTFKCQNLKCSDSQLVWNCCSFSDSGEATLANTSEEAVWLSVAKDVILLLVF